MLNSTVSEDKHSLYLHWIYLCAWGTIRGQLLVVRRADNVSVRMSCGAASGDLVKAAELQGFRSTTVSACEFSNDEKYLRNKKKRFV